MSEALGRLIGHARKYSLRRARRKSERESQNSVVVIHNLKSSRDDGILYPDDQLNDVADDREQIIADFEENYSPVPQSLSADVTSTSSVCTGSPDLFTVEVGSHCSIPYHCSDVEITEESHPLTVMPLQVRRGSEPALNCLFPSSDPNKRWSTAVVMHTTDNGENSPDILENGKEEECASPEILPQMNGDSKLTPGAFLRGSGRLSILGNNPETYRWVEAADRQLVKDFNENFTLKPISYENGNEDGGSDTSSMSDEREKTVILKNESGPLGIHVVPDYDIKGRDTGLVIQGIEAGGRIDRDGRFCVGDRITEINGKSLQNVSFQAAQEIFKDALKSPEIKLELIRSNERPRTKATAAPKKPPPPVYPKPSVAEPQKRVEEEASLVEGEERAGGISTKVATVTPTKKVPASATRRIASANTRKIGRMLTIELTKGPAGLGFSITTRDNPAGGNSPIYIKNVLPKGAAIEDGRLLPGDRLLEVNGIPMTGKTQADAVAILRNVPLGNTVQLVVSRQNIEEPEPVENENETVSAKLDEESGIFPWKHREILTFQIPLTDCHSAGLGVSVKGKSTTTASGSVDLGIFIKSVIPGGAAFKDGRLQTNDQLVNINGISLLAMSNSNAMETLRNAMTQSDGPIRNAIILTIARRIHQPSDGESAASLQKPEATAGGSKGSSESGDSSKVKQLTQTSSRTKLDLDSNHNSATLPPGCNPVIERLTGQALVDMMKSHPKDIYPFGKNDPAFGRGDKPKPYCATLASSQNETVIIEGEYDPSSKKPEDRGQPQNGLPDAAKIESAGSLLSLDEANPGFERDGFGRQSMSEKRHAQLDAKSTDTYQRTKKAREDKDRLRQQLETEYGLTHKQGGSSGSKSSEPGEVGPSLGLRKSSSLESLQTMIQELNRDDEAKKKAHHTGTSRSSRSRGCNESFRAAVDRSYDAPASATMDTLDEESESGSSVGHMLARSAELPDSNHNMHIDPFHDELLSMYGRGSKSSKKKSLLKGLGSVFKFGKNRKQSQDLKRQEDDSLPDEVFQSTSKDHDNRSFDGVLRDDIQRRQLPQIPIQSTSAPNLDGVPNRQERMQSLREQHQRLHQKRQGHYPLDLKEEYYENELKEKEKYVVPPEVIHGRSHSFDFYKEPAQNQKAPPSHPSDPDRYSHYMNYKEIQQHYSQHHDHIRTMPPKMKSDSKILPPLDCAPSSYTDYESVHRYPKYTPNQGSDISSSSLPRGSHFPDNKALAHSQAQRNKSYFVHEAHDHGNYGHMKVHPYYPSNNKLYSHIVPGSKV